MRIRRSGRSVGGKGRFALSCTALVAACLAVGLLSPLLAGAEQSTFYASFTKCDTSVPEMNDPATEEAACFSNITRFGTVKIGFFEMPLTSAVHMQFAVAGVEPGDAGEEGLVHVVPGSTVLDAAPVFIPNPLANGVEDPPVTPGAGPVPTAPQAAPAGSAQPAPKQETKQQKKKKKRKKARKHRGKGHHKKAKKGVKGKHRRLVGLTRAQANATPLPKISVSTVLAGDVEEFNLIVAGTEEPGGVAMKLPIRLHLEGEGLGANCYIGTEANPILAVLKKMKPESTFFFGSDPNDFPIRLVGSGGSKLEDSTFAVPAASGCGPGGINDEPVNELVGLPAPAGSSRMVFADNLFEFVGAGYDGVGLEGGAELQAAFDAAR